VEKHIVTLTKEERKMLSDIASKGKQKSQKILNALICLVVTKASANRTLDQ